MGAICAEELWALRESRGVQSAWRSRYLRAGLFSCKGSRDLETQCGRDLQTHHKAEPAPLLPARTDYFVSEQPSPPQLENTGKAQK